MRGREEALVAALSSTTLPGLLSQRPHKNSFSLSTGLRSPAPEGRTILQWASISQGNKKEAALLIEWCTSVLALALHQ